MILGCGAYCAKCDVNGVNLCDPNQCLKSGLSTAVVYSNSSQSCIREYTQQKLLLPHFLHSDLLLVSDRPNAYEVYLLLPLTCMYIIIAKLQYFALFLLAVFVFCN